MYIPEPLSDEDALSKFYDTINSVQMPFLNVQKQRQEYKKICKYLSVLPRARIKEKPYIRSYRYPPA